MMKMFQGWGARAGVAGLIGAGICSVASAGSFVYDEGVDGDLSDDWLSPTQLSPFGAGQSVVSLSVVNSDDPEGDRDYFTINVPVGFQLDSIDLLALNAGGGDSVAFVGIQAGDQVTVDPNFPNPEPLLGWTLTLESFVGEDLLAILIGEENTPLGAGQYSFWIQQTGQEMTSMSLGFNVSLVPAPGATGLAGLVLLGAMRRRR